jgi:hypothetical protein
VRSDVARIEVRYYRGHSKSVTHAEATVAQVNGELLNSLGQTTPFGRFAVVLPGCDVAQRMRLVAFNSEGQRVGSQRGRKARWAAPCQPQRHSRREK